MKHRMSTVLSLLTLALILSSGEIYQAVAGGPPYYFTNEVAAFTNGQAVLTALQNGDAQSRKQIQTMVGSRVLFDGLGLSPDGLKLKLDGNVILVIEIPP